MSSVYILFVVILTIVLRRYLVSFIVQFQFHKAACLKAGEYVPGDPQKLLSNCDIYQSANAGNALKYVKIIV